MAKAYRSGLFTVLTLRKLRNICRIYSSYYLSIILKKPVVWGNPVSISIEPSSVCNLHCPECPAGKRQLTRQTGLLPFEKFSHYLSFFEKDLLYLTLYFQGEPFMNNEIFNMITHAKKKKIYVTVSTNAHYLTKENCSKIVQSGLDHLIISLDGTDQETYSKYRIGGDFEKVQAGVKELIAARKNTNVSKPLVTLQFLVFKYNQHLIGDFKKLGENLHVDDVSFKSAQIYDIKHNYELIPDIKKYSRYVKNSDGEYHIKMKQRNRCKRIWQSLVVIWNGAIVPCCYDKDADHAFGNLNERAFSEIRKNVQFMNFRKKVLTERKNIEICANCTE
jgi:radical SAM protein with 4Fe4S-binding SPASM domain